MKLFLGRKDCKFSLELLNSWMGGWVYYWGLKKHLLILICWLFAVLKCDIQMCQFGFVFPCRADVLFMFFIHSHQNIKLLNVFVQIVKCIFWNCKMYLSCWCIIYVCWEAFSSIQIKIFEAFFKLKHFFKFHTFFLIWDIFEIWDIF